MKVLCKPCKLKMKIKLYENSAKSYFVDETDKYMLEHLRNNIPIPVVIGKFGSFCVTEIPNIPIYCLIPSDYYEVKENT